MASGSERPGGDLPAYRRALHRPELGRWGRDGPACGCSSRLISFHLVRLAPGGLARASTNPHGAGANRQGGVVPWVVPWVEGVDSGLWRASSSLCFRGRGSQQVGVGGPLPSPPLWSDNETAGSLLTGLVCLVAMRRPQPRRHQGAARAGSRPGRIGAGGPALAATRAWPRPLGNTCQPSASVRAARSRSVNFDKMLLLPLLSNPRSRKEVGRDDPDKVCPARWPVKLRRLPSYTLWSQVGLPAVLRP